ncbi:MAG: DUF362 domain-containing protein [Candidatus Riflebacteria bacterium]|nr:DUF362 domain-containing protein [Candidatus Riflebacteria bacterium]
MAKVFFHPLSQGHSVNDTSVAAQKLLEILVESEKISFAPKVPLKVHFGEMGNQTFIRSENFEGIIDYLKRQNIESCYIETNVLYLGQRANRTNHLKTAIEHGFTQLPIEIADGEVGEEFSQVKIDGKQFKTCLIASGFKDYKQLIVLAHFKGHMLAGFGGAIKQLAMGCASRGGKMAQHQSAKPFIIPFFCKNCGACKRVCPADAITVGKWSRINQKKCLGCAACLGICKSSAIHTNYLRFFMLGNFTARLAEYAFSAQLRKKNLYLNFGIDITEGCDCEFRKMVPFLPDIGIFASVDPVAIDQACLDKMDMVTGKKVFKRGRETLDFAEKLGMGMKKYDLITV